MALQISCLQCEMSQIALLKSSEEEEINSEDNKGTKAKILVPFALEEN